MPSRRLKLTDPETGRTATINWNAKGDPTDSDIAEIFTEQQRRSKEEVNKAANKPLPLTKLQSFSASPAGKLVGGFQNLFEGVGEGMTGLNMDQLREQVDAPPKPVGGLKGKFFDMIGGSFPSAANVLRNLYPDGPVTEEELKQEQEIRQSQPPKSTGRQVLDAVESLPIIGGIPRGVESIAGGEPARGVGQMIGSVAPFAQLKTPVTARPIVQDTKIMPPAPVDPKQIGPPVERGVINIPKENFTRRPVPPEPQFTGPQEIGPVETFIPQKMRTALPSPAMRQLSPGPTPIEQPPVDISRRNLLSSAPVELPSESPYPVGPINQPGQIQKALPPASTAKTVGQNGPPWMTPTQIKNFAKQYGLSEETVNQANIMPLEDINAVTQESRAAAAYGTPSNIPNNVMKFYTDLESRASKALANTGKTVEKKTLDVPQENEQVRGVFGQAMHEINQELNNAAKDSTLSANVSIPTKVADKGISLGRAAFTSADQTLLKNPATAPFVHDVRDVHLAKQQFRYDVFREFEDTFKGFPKTKKGDLRDYLEGKYTGNDPQVIQVGKTTRVQLDLLHKEAVARGVTADDGKPLGYLSDYLSHIVKDPTLGDSILEALQELTLKGKAAKLKENIGNLISGKKPLPENAPGNVSSRFTKERKREIPEKLLETDIYNILRTYVDSMSRVMFDKPMVTRARKRLKNMPNSLDKSLANYYVDRYAGLEDPGNALVQGMKYVDRTAARVGARSVLAGSTKLQVYHVARTIVQILPELGPVNTVIGAGKMLTDFKGSVERAARAGLLPNETIPNRFKTKMEIFDNMVNYGDIGNKIAKVIAHEGNRAKLKKAGDPHWEKNAVYEAARQEGFVNPTSPIWFQDKMPKYFMMFKYWIHKYGENVSRAYIDAALKRDAASFQKAALYALTAAATLEAGKQVGVSIFHLRGKSMVTTGSPQKQAAEKIWGQIAEGKFSEAALEMVRLAPGGRSFVKSDPKNRGKLKFEFPSLDPAH